MADRSLSDSRAARERAGARPPTSGLLLVNPRSGTDRPTTDELVASARSRGIECHVLREGEDAAAVVRAANAQVVGVAGGDGSLASVAAVAIERNLPFVCIPYGTRNHFARDVGLDRDDPLGALAAFEGAERRIDVGRLNGRVFLNNVSLGLYAGLVLRRERHRRRGEVLAGVRALARLTRRRHRLRARIGDATLRARILLVANNAYELSLYSVGARPRLDEGTLHLYCADGWLPTTWVERASPQFRIELDRAHVVAAADGEPIMLESPLEVESLPQALRVLVP